MTVDPHKYNITIRKVDIEGEVCFEASIKELPHIFEYGDTYEEAYDLAIDSIRTTIDVFVEMGRTPPAPIIPPEEYSGRVTLRLPKSLHRKLAITADDEGVSLNHLLVTAVAHYVGEKQSALMPTTAMRKVRVMLLDAVAGTFDMPTPHSIPLLTNFERNYLDTATNSQNVLLCRNTNEAAHV